MCHIKKKIKLGGNYIKQYFSIKNFSYLSQFF